MKAQESKNNKHPMNLDLELMNSILNRVAELVGVWNKGMHHK